MIVVVRCLLVVWISLVAIGVGAISGAAEDSPVRAALERRVDVDFVETPLADVMTFLSEQLRIPITFDHRALEGAAIRTDTPITVRLKLLKLRSALYHLLRDLELTFVEDDERILVTTMEEANRRLATRVTSVADLIRPADTDSAELRFELLHYLQGAGIPQPGWREVGGLGTMTINRAGILIVSSTPPVLDRIDVMLNRLRSVAKGSVATEKPDLQVVRLDETDQRINMALDKGSDFDFVETPLSDVADFLGERHKIHVLLDRKVLAGAGVDANFSITVRTDKIPVRRAMQRMLPDFLAWKVHDEALVITTREEVNNSLFARLYPVPDFAPGNDREQVRDALDELAEHLVEFSGHPVPGWVEEGGVGSFQVLSTAKTIAVWNTDDVHDQITRLLADLRRTRAAQPEASAAKPRLQTRTYQVTSGEMAREGTDPTPARKLARQLKATIATDSWGDDGHRVQVNGDTLIVSHSTDVHRQVKRMIVEVNGANAVRTASGGSNNGRPFGTAH